MSFFDWWEGNRQKTLGGFIALFSTIGVLIAAGAFDNLLSETAIGWLGIACALVTGVAGGSVSRTGFQNTTKERVAQAAATVEVAKAQQAVAIKSVVESSPGGKP